MDISPGKIAITFSAGATCTNGPTSDCSLCNCSYIIDGLTPDTSEEHKSAHLATPVSFDARRLKLATLAVESFGRLGIADTANRSDRHERGWRERRWSLAPQGNLEGTDTTDGHLAQGAEVPAFAADSAGREGMSYFQRTRGSNRNGYRPHG